jgi:hypothetical protein
MKRLIVILALLVGPPSLAVPPEDAPEPINLNQVVTAPPKVTPDQAPLEVAQVVQQVPDTPVAIPEESDETLLETAILDQALTCGGAKVGQFDRQLLHDLLRIEEDFQVPMPLRGMVLAAACVESGYNPDAEGDHKFSPRGRPVAIGILQMWPWWQYGPYGPKVNRRDPRAAARAWLAHVVKQLPTIQRQCRYNKPEQVDQLWRTAWITAVRAPAKKPRCKQTFSHWHTHKRWRLTWQSLLDSDLTEAPEGVSGIL